MPPATRKRRPKLPAISRVQVAGYKSLSDPASIEIRPLTLLAGANSSGKSSALQPLLLLKQTLESTYDPGPLLLNGPHVRFSEGRQLFSRLSAKTSAKELSVGISLDDGETLELVFVPDARIGIDLARMRVSAPGGKATAELWPEMTKDEILRALGRHWFLENLPEGARFSITRDRCLLEVEVKGEQNRFRTGMASQISRSVRDIIHVPAQRGNPQRAYPRTATGVRFEGTFDSYVASLIHLWQEQQDTRLVRLVEFLQRLELTTTVSAKRVDDIQLELLVGRRRLAANGQPDLVNIADVGFGVSQVLPVLVALLAARPGQLVYLEEPEIHLHPRAQWRLAELVAEVAADGPRVVMETHSSLLLRGIQCLVAKGTPLKPEDVALHFFELDDRGLTTVRSAELDATGAFGDWPVDFDSVELEAESRYLDAAEAAQQKAKKRARAKK